MPEDYEQIVEFSFNEKAANFVVRFLDGESYVLDASNLPRKLQTKKPNWKKCIVSPGRGALLLQMEKEIREIPSFLIHSKGRKI